MKYLLMGLCIFFDIVYIACKRKGRNVIGVLAKVLAASCFIYLGYLGYKANPSEFKYYILFGLLLDGIGDLFLGLRNLFLKNPMFFCGGLSFLAGHIMYIRALFPLSNNYKFYCIIGGIIIGVVVFSIFDNICKFSKALKYLGITYFVMIMIMAILSIGIYATYKSTSNLIFMMGAVLFVSSDCILVLYNFSKKEEWMHPVYSLLYFLGQILISFSLML